MMRRLLTIAVLSCAAVLAAQSPPAADPRWVDALERATREKKPVIVFFRPVACRPCDEFERVSLPHPTIQRRIPDVVFVTLPVTSSTAAREWKSAEPGVALFDRSGVLRARWRVLPDTMRLGLILDSAKVIARRLERAVQLTEAGSHDEADLVVADALATIRRIPEARAALSRASASKNPAIQREAAVAGAVLDAREGRRSDAIVRLERVIAASATDAAGRAAVEALAALRATDATEATPPIRILPMTRQVISGRQLVRTNVSSAAISRVTFFFDGREAARATRPPYSARLDFGRTPERHSIRAVAFDRRGREVGRDEMVVNEAGETFWVRLVEPREGPASGTVKVSLSTRAPAAQLISRAVVTWNDAERAVVRSAPWEASVHIPDGQTGVLRVVAELQDGRTSEDAVLLNAGGAIERADVHLVGLPITVLDPARTASSFAPSDVVVREGSRTRRVESVASAEETPLTVGLLIDTSASMHKMLPDVQEAAARFATAVLTARDRSFLVRFDTRATLLQPSTNDAARLSRRIAALQPGGLTALYDATALGLLQFEGVTGRRALILFSDGLDRTSEYTAAEVGELARRTNVPIHFIASIPGVPAGVATNPAAAAGPESVDAAMLRVVESTGGTFHVLRDLGELPAVFSRIEAALRAQLLAFIRTEGAARENEWRPVQIEVRGANGHVYAPAGYYAPW